MTDYQQLHDGNPDGAQIGQSATDKLAFYGTTPVAQQTFAIATSDIGTASSADVTTALKAAVIDIQNKLEAIGLIDNA